MNAPMVYQALDDEALAGLASKGLLRRAYKDLERSSPALTEQTGSAFVLDWPEESCQMTLPHSGPGQASCTCAAEGCCRHILAGAIFLRSYAVPPAADSTEQSTLPDEIVRLEESDLVAWATRPLYRRALEDLILGDLDISIETEIVEQRARGIIVFRFPQLNVVARYVVGAGLAGMLCSCKRPVYCLHRVASILVYQSQHGKLLTEPTAGVLRAASGAPRTRHEVLNDVQRTIVELLALGSSRLSRATVQRLQTLAISAHGVDLPRLERSVRALASHAAWHVDRDVRASISALLAAATQTYALSVALADAGDLPSAGLVGEHRSRYFEVGTLELTALGAQQWRTRSGYAGLTLFFWDHTACRWSSWSDSRPAFSGSQPFQPQQRYSQEGMWDGTVSPSMISRSRLRLGSARRNRTARLSSHPATQLFVNGPARPESLPLEGARFDDWQALAQRIATLEATGLGEHQLLDSLVVVVPATWQAPVYDHLRQTLIRPVRDHVGRCLRLVLPYNEHWSFAVDTLQGWRPDDWGTWGVLGFARLTIDGIDLTPVALLNHRELPPPLTSHILNLTLDQWNGAQPYISPHPVPTESVSPSDDDDDIEAVEAAPIQWEHDGTAVGRVLRAALDELEQMAERGVATRQSESEHNLAGLVNRLKMVGLEAAATALAAVVASSERSRHSVAIHPQESALCLLRCTYILRVAQHQLTLVQAMAALEVSNSNIQ